MTDGLIRKLATLTSVKRTRIYDQQRIERNGDPGRDARIAEHLTKVQAEVDALKGELKL